LLPALSKAKQKALGISCINNLKQLTLAAHLYANDFQDAIPPNGVYNVKSWVMTATPSGVAAMPEYADSTLIRKCVLYPYNNSEAIYRCPGDRDMIPGQSSPRVRNYSMSCMMGDNLGTGISGGNENKKFSAVYSPSPTYASLFIDEQSSAGTSLGETSIDDGYFAIPVGDSGPTWFNSPASRHGNYGQFSFADGHAALMKWLEPTTRRLRGNCVGSNSKGVAKDRDLHQVWRSMYADGAPGSSWP